MKDDERDPRKGYGAVAIENDPVALQALANDGDEAVEAEEREKKLVITALRRSYIVRKKAP